MLAFQEELNQELLTIRGSNESYRRTGESARNYQEVHKKLQECFKILAENRGAIERLTKNVTWDENGTKVNSDSITNSIVIKMVRDQEEVLLASKDSEWIVAMSIKYLQMFTRADEAATDKAIYQV